MCVIYRSPCIHTHTHIYIHICVCVCVCVCMCGLYTNQICIYTNHPVYIYRLSCTYTSKYMCEYIQITLYTYRISCVYTCEYIQITLCHPLSHRSTVRFESHPVPLKFRSTFNTLSGRLLGSSRTLKRPKS